MGERVYVLDAGVLIALQRTAHLPALTEASEKVLLVLLEEVVDELVRVPSRHAKAGKQVEDTLAQSRIQRKSIDMGAPARDKFDAMRAGRTSTADLGEAASIAWASGEPAAIFVTADARAALRGLEELRGRVLGFYSLLAEWVEKGALGATVATQIAADAGAAQLPGVREPIWWTAWSAGLRDIGGQAGQSPSDPSATGGS